MRHPGPYGPRLAKSGQSRDNIPIHFDASSREPRMNHRIFAAIMGGLMLTGSASAQVKPLIFDNPKPFGKTADGTAVESYTLKNTNGVTVKLINLGATITEINVPDKHGKFANVVLGFDDIAGYQSKSNQHFG